MQETKELEKTGQQCCRRRRADIGTIMHAMIGSGRELRGAGSGPVCIACHSHRRLSWRNDIRCLTQVATPFASTGPLNECTAGPPSSRENPCRRNGSSPCSYSTQRVPLMLQTPHAIQIQGQ
jgi:hypothetical protein